MNGQHLTIKEKRAKLGFLPALANPRRRRIMQTICRTHTRPT